MAKNILLTNDDNASKANSKGATSKPKAKKAKKKQVEEPEAVEGDEDLERSETAVSGYKVLYWSPSSMNAILKCRRTCLWHTMLSSVDDTDAAAVLRV